MKKFITIIAVLLISAGFGPAAYSSFAQGQYGQYSEPQGAPPPPTDQPNTDQGETGQTDATSQPGVARASYVQGDVSYQRGDNSDLVPVTLNTPLQNGDRISTSGNSRAEIELDYADQLRLAGDSTAKVADLTRQNIQIQVGQGLANYSVLPGGQATVEIDTPNASIKPSAQGDYRILVNSDAETKVIVRNGSADVSTPEGSTRVDAGQMITIAGTNDAQYRIDSAPGRDDWDAWNADRDSHVRSAQSFRNTNQYYTGSEDLDGYGEWSEVPDYGQVWFPSYGSDWAPYRDGSWVYEPYYGWTWVSYEPWGWAPYHYGRWFVYGGRWGWWPGVAYAGYYPVWAPAYVSFFGWGGGGWGVGFGFGWGNVGWLPIGPCDWYHPWYGRYGGNFTQINIYNYNNIHEGFGPLRGDRGRQFSNLRDAQFNDRVRGGISSMGGNEFGRGRVPAHQQPISSQTFRDARGGSGRLPMSPSRESYSPTGHFANANSFRNAPPTSQRFFTANRGNTSNNNALKGPQNGFNNAHQQGFGGDRNGNAPSRGQGLSQQQPQGQQPQSTRPGWRTFTPPNNGNRNAQKGFGGNRNGNGPATNGAPENRGAAPTDNRGGQGNGNNGFRTFTPPSRNEQQGFGGNRNGSNPAMNGATENRGAAPTDNRSPQGNNNWRTFTPPARTAQPSQPQDSGGSWRQSTNRSYQAPQMDRQPDRGNPNQGGRPPLNMRQPVVTPRNNPDGNGNGQPRGGNFSEPPRGGYMPQSQPQQPRGGFTPQQQPRGNFGGGGYAPQAQPRGGNGGGFSAPRGGNGGGFSGPRSGGGGNGGGGGGGGGGNRSSGGGGDRHR